jgi:hypothetical protein
MLSCAAICPKHDQFIACTKIGFGGSIARQNLKVTNSAQNRRSGAEASVIHGAARILRFSFRSRCREYREMTVLLQLGIMVLASAACGAAHATPSAYSNFDVVSVVPRSPNVKPLVMSISTRERRKYAASLQLGAFDANR